MTGGPGRPRLSVVIPCRNDGAALERTLTHLEGLPRRGDLEVIP